MAPLRGTAARLAIALLCAFGASALWTAQASADCPICDQYTLDIPDPQSGGNPGGEPAPEPAPEPPAATVPASPAPVAPAPAVTPPVETATAVPVSEEPEKEREPEPEPQLQPILAATDGSTAPRPATSVPLGYDESDSVPAAAIAGLGSPGTLALLAALIAAGASVAIARRRAAER